MIFNGLSYDPEEKDLCVILCMKIFIPIGGLFLFLYIYKQKAFNMRLVEMLKYKHT